MKTSEVHEMTDDELLGKEKELQRAVFNLRVQYSTGQLTNTAALKITRRDLARIKTIIKERRLTRTGAGKTG